MGLSQAGKAAIGLTIPGLLAFIFAVAAENKKPADPSSEPDLVYDATTETSTCHYPKDPTLALGIVALIFLLISAVFSTLAFYFPYNGRRVSTSILWRSTTLLVFTVISLVLFLVSEALLLWAIIVEVNHHIHNVHSGQIVECPSAKSGLFGGAGFLCLDTTLFFLLVLMLTVNTRADHLMAEEHDDGKGDYGEVTTYVPSQDGLHDGGDRV